MKWDVDSPGYVIGFTVVLATIFTAVVMSVQVATASKVRRNEELREERALVKVFGLGDVAALSDEEIGDLIDRRIERGTVLRDPETGEERRFFRAYEAGTDPETRGEGDLLGVGLEVSGNGFWAPITGILALTPDGKTVLGIEFLSHSETPGLGGRITEDAFQDQFEGLDVSPPEKVDKYLYVEKQRPDKSDPRYDRTVDAITGATQTSVAVGRFLNSNLEAFSRAYAEGPIQVDPEATD
jgi:Na+-transporting NADH:ubiquinone oxidoreductase subunit C